MLDEENVLVKTFRMVKEKINQENLPNVSLRLLGKRGRDGRTYNLPTISEIDVLVVGDFDEALGDRDIIVENRSGRLQRIDELHPSYLALQYPLLLLTARINIVKRLVYQDLALLRAIERELAQKSFFHTDCMIGWMSVLLFCMVGDYSNNLLLMLIPWLRLDVYCLTEHNRKNCVLKCIVVWQRLYFEVIQMVLCMANESFCHPVL